MSRETKKAIDHPTPMTQRTESGASAYYETKVFFGIGQRGVKGLTGEITWIPEGQCWRNCEAF